jgi:hypothetical protein
MASRQASNGTDGGPEPWFREGPSRPGARARLRIVDRWTDKHLPGRELVDRNSPPNKRATEEVRSTVEDVADMSSSSAVHQATSRRFLPANAEKEKLNPKFGSWVVKQQHVTTTTVCHHHHGTS